MDSNIISNFKMLSFNVRGLRDEHKRTSIFNYVRRKNIDLCLIQEAHCTEKEENIWENQWGGKIIFSHGASNARGVIVLIKPSLDCKIIDIYKDNQGRYLEVNCSIQGTNFKVINLYAPNNEMARLNFLKDIKNRLDKEDREIYKGKIILGGDLNLVQDEHLDRKGGTQNFSNLYKLGITTLTGIKEEHDMVDLWRLKHPTTKRFTWRQKNPLISSRLDVFLVSTLLSDYAVEIDILPSFRSDHSPVVMSIKTFENRKGPGLWKLNNTFLDDSKYIEKISGLINNLKQNQDIFADQRVWWEYLKYKIREFSLNYGRQRAKETRENEKHYESELKLIEEKIDSLQNDNELSQLNQRKDEITANILEMDRIKTEGIILRSRCRWHEEGEKNNKYFLNLCSRNKVKTTVNKLLREDGIETQNQNEIIEMQKSFYKKLYAKQNTETTAAKTHYLRSINTSTLSNEDKIAGEGLLTLDELTKSMKSFKNNKTPGNDGLTVEFYRKFWGPLCKPLLDTLNYSYSVGELSLSQRQAVITLLDKGKDRQLLKNWRPLSMLNVDYKLGSKAIAERIKLYLPKLIHTNQVGYISGRHISNNIRAISDILEYTKLKGIPGVIVNIDFEKAFDSVNWEFLILTMKKFNFGESIIKWVETFYSNISSCVISNGWTSEYFEVERGVRQGDPLSPYLFVMVAEILACSIRQDDKISGIKIGNEEIKLVQYADDTNGVLSNEISARYFLKNVETFGRYSGLKLNIDKTEGAWIGSLRNNQTKPLGIKWPDTPLRILGVYVSYNKDECNKLNFEDKIQKCKQLINSWIPRNLTLIGKSIIIRTFIISQFLYATSAIDIPDKYVSEIENLIYNFIWSGKKPKIRREILRQSTENGGLNVPDIKTMLEVNKVKWIQKYEFAEYHVWKTTLKSFLEYNDIDLDVLLHANYDINKLCGKKRALIIPSFYIKMLRTWSEISETQSPKETFLWYNKKFLIDYKPFFYRDFYENGIKSVSDLYANGEIIPFQVHQEKGLNRTDWFKWYTLVQMIKKEAVTQKQLNDTGSKKIVLKTAFFRKVTSRVIYELFMEKRYAGIATEPRIIKYVKPTQLSKKEIFFICHRMVIDTKTKEFQYKFLNNILVNNHLLKKWKIKESDSCTFCKIHDETIDHLFWECPVIKDFWSDVTNYMEPRINMKLNKEIIFYGIKDMLMCTIIFSAKKFIYTCRYYDSKPSLTKYLCNLRLLRMKEFMISQKNNTLSKFMEKWEQLDL